jgi:DNA-binding NarL/FixJ family response regulator
MPTKARQRARAISLANGRQLDVLALMMQGKSNKAICRALNLVEPTVKAEGGESHSGGDSRSRF